LPEPEGPIIATNSPSSISKFIPLRNKSEADLQNTYNNARNALLVAVDTGKTALLTLSDIQDEYFNDRSQQSFVIENSKETAIFELFGRSNAGKMASQFVSKLDGGVYGDVRSLDSNSLHEEIDTSLKNTISALQKVKMALDSVVILQEIVAADETKLEGEKININAETSTLTGHEQLINLQKVTNENTVNTAETEVNTAENLLSTTQDELALKKAGYTQEQIKAQEALVKQAEANLASQQAEVSSRYANVQNYQALLDKTILYAPITGLVTKMEAKVGEIVFPSSQFSTSQFTLVSIISDKNYEIETHIAEVDIAKIKIGHQSDVTLDAYGSDVNFTAVVTEIDPGETVIDGIPTYKVTLQFQEENIGIKPGMTANLDILTAEKQDVIAIPQRAVITKDGGKIVRILKVEEGQQIVEEVEVITGLRGSDGRIEILEGLNEGDNVVLSIEE